MLIYDLRVATRALDDLVFTPLSQNQVDALASFVFSIGAANFRRSAVLRRLNEGAMLDAAVALESWRQADAEGGPIVLDAFVRRRAVEKALFLTPQEGWIAAPMLAVEPVSDIEAADLDPVEASPIEMAAANLAARLRVLAPEAEETFEGDERLDPPPLLVEDPSPEPPGPIEFDPPSAFEPFPFGLEAEPTPDPAVLRRAIYGEPEPRPEIPASAYAPLALLGGAGLAVFAGAVILAFHAHSAGGALGPLNVGVMIVGLIGVACVASAVYLALEKRAGRGE